MRADHRTKRHGSNPQPPHLSCSTRALLLARQNRALRIEPPTFLLDRVAEDMEERLHAVLRDFSDVADIWSPG
jgi:hypothetical protein